VSLVGLTKHIAQSATFQTLVEDVRARNLSRGLGAPRAGHPLIVAALHHTLDVPILYITASVEQSRLMTDALAHLTDANPIRFAEPNTAFYDAVAPVRDVIAQRSIALAALVMKNNDGSSFITGHSSIVVASPRALMHPTLPAHRFELGTRTIKLDQTISLEAMLAHWVSVGYEHEPVVERVGAFSRRGGIIDVWSPAHALPIRIELFGNVADSIRLFDPETQRSGQALAQAFITPLEVLGGLNFSSLIDYLSSDALLIIDDEEELREAWLSLEEKARRERETLESSGAEMPTTKPYIEWGEIEKSFHPEQNATRLKDGSIIFLGQSLESQLSAHPISNCFKQPPHFAGQLTPLMEYLKTKEQSEKNTDQSCVVVSRQAARLAEVWSEKNELLAAQKDLSELPHGAIHFVVGALSSGFIFEDAQSPNLSNSSLQLLTDNEIFGYVKPESFVRGRARKAAPEKAFADWQIADAVVHEDYGVGLYRGLVKLTVNTGTYLQPQEGEREYLLLEFADADRLYVPLHQLDRVQRYVGSEEDKPQLDKLHSGEWEKAKSKARGAAAEIARDMLKLYAERELAKGFAFNKDSAWQTELESSFPYVETDDQLRAIEDVKRDMERQTPMDRLVVGDVGFGKTEVALRAAFKAAQDGKQVAVLVPTTVLAQQHWNTFSKRLEAYPINVEMLSRFRTAAEKREIIEKLGKGEVDVVIGTHALVGKEIKFKDLGLVIIDEEHRFGVVAKEKLKQLRTEVDVLTLSATPIPRTLYLGLSGVRAISKIETPPAERLPIISFVGAWDDAIVQQAIRRELDRDGQVFFVHNRIQSIGLAEQKLRRLVPEASLSIAHGQMDERQLARIMSNFADGKIDILLCTNIIESGLDIQNANTILIDNADHFGLAELYQLRGRVGRSTIQAYAYFLYDRKARMTAEARERLETLRETAGIGAGYSISMRDLEMRGSGDLLGAKQSGHISAVGYDLYTRLLAREVGVLRALRDGTAMPPPEVRPITIDLPLTVGLPESYINDDSLRVQLYRRAASLDNEEKIRIFEEELTDRFGKLPQPALNLTYQIRLKLAASEFDAQSITTEGNRFTIRADSLERLSPTRLQLLLGQDALIGRRQVSFLRHGAPEQWKQKLMDVTKKLAQLVAASPLPKAKPSKSSVLSTRIETS
jgi:transcription-repair coupling factor (superfamily II helicase)